MHIYGSDVGGSNTCTVNEDDNVVCVHANSAVNYHWTGLLERTTGLTFFALIKNIFILSDKSQLPVELHSIRNGTYLAAQTHLKQANSRKM